MTETPPDKIKHRHGGWHEHALGDLGDATEPHVHGNGSWLMSVAELRAAIGAGDSSEGLPHWHTVIDTPDGQPRHGVYVERQRVLDLLDIADRAAPRPGEPQ